MATIDLEAAVAEFLSLGKRLTSAGPPTCDAMIAAVLPWYRETRVKGAELDADGDMLLLQWGSTRPLILAEPTDLRGMGDDATRFDSRDLQYLNLTRQVSLTADDSDFDDVAVQMSITLGFDDATANEPGGNLWIAQPNSLDAGVTQFLSTPFVATLHQKQPRRVAISVENCG
ncbi:MAG: hypothetical protein AMXMBFR47_02790 [Planctomycetota bacterium]